jgi:hypothetical protein
MTIDVRPPSGIFHPGYISGRWYAAPPKSGSTGTPSADTVYFVPTPIYRPCVISDLALALNTSSGGAQSARLAVYADLNGVPTGSVLSDGSATIDLTQAAGAYSVTLNANVSVNTGLIWLAVWVSTSGGGLAVLRCGNALGSNSYLIGGATVGGSVLASSGNSSGYSKASTFGASFPAATSLSGANFDWALGFKVA